jgi:hypothetical protein
MVIKRVGVMSCARISGILYGLLGLIAGAIFSMIALIVGFLGVQGQNSYGPFFGVVFGVGAVLTLPLLYGGMGFATGALSAALYNWVSSFVGGLQMEVE